MLEKYWNKMCILCLFHVNVKMILFYHLYDIYYYIIDTIIFIFIFILNEIKIKLKCVIKLLSKLRL